VKVIILIGPPGSGKGTQAYLLNEELKNVYYFETSKIIEANVMDAKEGDTVEIEGEKYPLTRERELWKSGILCTPKVVSFWVVEKFRELASEGQSIVIAGSPRTLSEGEEVIPILEDLYGKENITIFEIKLRAEQSLWRNSHRRICSLFRHPIIYNEGTKNLTVCPLDGSKLLRREGLDDVETIKVRLKEYEERTEPLLGFMANRGFEINVVNGEQGIENVHEDIMKAIK